MPSSFDNRDFMVILGGPLLPSTPALVMVVVVVKSVSLKSNRVRTTGVPASVESSSSSSSSSELRLVLCESSTPAGRFPGL